MLSRRQLDELVRRLSLEAYTGPLTAGISGSIIDIDLGVRTAKCPLCPHVLDIVGRGFHTSDSGDDKDDVRGVVMCGACLAFLFITPPGFTPVSASEFKKLPKDMRLLLERMRETVLTRGHL